ncbi:L,D-transpeptidase [Caproicibacter sp.]|uniref:L,D-transpeptidase n=1 Tax=Caproicibacter sp. TaxID=2814884 RepID=UPI003989DB3E
MKEFGKRPLNRILLVALILFVGAGATYASLRPVQFRAGVTAVVDWMKFDMIAEAAKKESSSAPPSGAAVSSAPDSSAPASSAPPQSQTSEEPSSSEAEKISLNEAAKPLKINVSLKDQKVFVLDAKDRLVQEYVCSSGEAGNDTPTGTFTVTDRGESFYNPAVKEGAYYWTRFYKTFLFHSVPFDENQKMEPQEAAKLGTPASHGCIRLETANAKWIYDNIPEGTTVVVQ